MRKVINVDIPKPCYEDWNKMTPDEKGRHCKVCQKPVFDFTSITDEYIVKTFTENTNICGCFKSKEIEISKDLTKVILLELEENVLGEKLVTVGGAISSSAVYQLTIEEELERKQKIEFARKNGKTFYRRNE